MGLYGTLVTGFGGSVGFLQDYLWDLLVLWDSCGTICAGFRVLWDSCRNICVGLRFMRDSSRTCVGLPLWNLLRIDGDSGFLQQAFLSNYIIHIWVIPREVAQENPRPPSIWMKIDKPIVPHARNMYAQF